MKNRLTSLFLLLGLIICLSACGNNSANSYFQITFFDVGQGDAALIECDKQFMLIDGGPKGAGEKIRNVLIDKGISRLDILVLSHLHEDHVGGMIDALSSVSRVGVTLANSNRLDSDLLEELDTELVELNAPVKIPKVGETYSLGSARVEVINSKERTEDLDNDNDSLVILITYRDTKFLFTGDIEASTQKDIYERYKKGVNATFPVDVLKMPHHGDYSYSLYNFIDTFQPKYSVISVGAGKRYGHPDQKTLESLEQFYEVNQNTSNEKKIFRTDEDGDIIVKSNGKRVEIKSSRG